MKTRRLGYDGKGQFRIQEKNDIDKAWQQLGAHALIAEQWIPFDHEVSVIGVRNADGDVAIYPLTLNEHIAGILRRSRAPVDIASQYTRRPMFYELPRTVLPRKNYSTVYEYR